MLHPLDIILFCQVKNGSRALKYEFENFQIDVSNRVLSREGEQVLLQSRAFDCLIYLVTHAGTLITKSEMMEAIWPDSFVEDSSLTVAISTIRRVLGEDHHERKYIQTVSGRGYRFVSAVREVSENTAPPQLEVREASPALAPATPASLDGLEDQSLKDASRVGSAPGFHHARWKQLFAALATAAFLIGCFLWYHSHTHSQVGSIAILPFSNVGKDMDDYVLLGMADSLMIDLNNELPVRQMSTVLQYSSGSPDPAAIGRQEGVDAVVTGRLTHREDTSVMHLVMLRSMDGHVFWQRDVSARAGDTIQMQSAIEAALRQEVEDLSRPSRRQQPAALPRPANPEAYQLYLRGRYFWSRRTDKSLQKSIDYYKQSVSIDPKFALAYAGLADSYALQADLSIAPGKTCGPDARAAALGAIALDPKLAEPHAALGMVSFFADWNGLEAEKEFQRAIAINPNYATAHHWYALDLAAMGRLPQALYEIRQAQALEPLSLIIGTNVGWILYLNRNYDEAIKQYARVVELDPNFARARTRMGMAQMQSGDLAGAIANLQAAEKISGDDPYVVGLLGQAQGMAGQHNEAEAKLHGLKSGVGARYVPPISRALVYLGMHDDQETLNELQQGFEDHSTALAYAKVDPAFDRLRNNARFVSMVSGMHF